MQALNQSFNQFLPIIEEDLRTILTPPENQPQGLFQMMHYHMGWSDEHGNPAETRGGKRIRPLVSMLVAQAINGDFNSARPGAAAVELVHNFSLLHDDIQDASPLRRNRPTVWKIWGEPQAINSGDTMFSLAQIAIIRLSRVHDHRTVRALQVLNETAVELTRGQYLDMRFEEQAAVTTEEYLYMINGKTAALLGGSTQLGALSAGADESIQANYRDFGINLGMAFQVRDDILDIWGDPEKTGKLAGVDIVHKKKTLPVLYALQHSASLRDRYLSQEQFTKDDVPSIIAMLDDVSAREFAEEKAKQYTQQTRAALEAAQPTGEAADALNELVDYLLHRKS